jgi:hypothetical protein|tara:strand:+ start:1973 stop:2308 length:336 start_codon:yes stop_codon:yes gene_type:complete
MKIHVSRKLSRGELEGLSGTSTYENLMKNKLCVYSKTTEDDTLWDIINHFDEHAQGLLHMSTLGNDNIWRIYFEYTGDMTSFLELINAQNKTPVQTGQIESIVVNTTHDTE